MKKLILSAVVRSMAVAVQAQDGRHNRHHGMKNHGEMMQKLNMTEEQKTKFKTENEAFRKKMEELKKKKSMTVKDWKSKMGEIRKDHKESIQRILTKEQKDQMQKMRSERQ